MGRRFRFIRGTLSQSEFAEKLGITQADVSRFERGKRAPSLEILLAVAHLGEVSIDFLVCGDLAPSKTAREHAPRYDIPSETLWVGNLQKNDQALLRSLARRLSRTAPA